MQRTIAIVVVGCAALALWAGPASAADTAISDSPAATETSQPPVPVTDVPAAPEQVTETATTVASDSVDSAATAQTPDLPEVATPAPAGPAVQTAAPDPAPVIRDVTSKAAPSIDTAVPASNAANVTKVTSKTSAAPAIHALPGGDTAKQTLNGVSDSAAVGGAASSIPDLGGPSPAGEQSASGPSGHEMLRGSMTPPRSTAGPGISVTVKHVLLMTGKGQEIFPSSLLEVSAPGGAAGSSIPSSAPATADSGPSLPGLPGPLQIPVFGSSGSTSTSSSGFFFFGFAGLLVGLWAAFAPALSRRLQGPPASWRPAPYLSLLELPG